MCEAWWSGDMRNSDARLSVVVRLILLLVESISRSGLESRGGAA